MDALIGEACIVVFVGLWIVWRTMRAVWRLIDGPPVERVVYVEDEDEDEDGPRVVYVLREPVEVEAPRRASRASRVPRVRASRCGRKHGRSCTRSPANVCCGRWAWRGYKSAPGGD
jgi:ABC-type nickel/cobalt efflux system permease component RcnA